MENRCGLCKCWVENCRVTSKDEEGKEHEEGFGSCKARAPVAPPFSMLDDKTEEIPAEEWGWPETFESSFCIHDFRLKEGLKDEIAKVTAMFGGKP